MADNVGTLKTIGAECSICLESFKKPRTLPCSHTFCHSCLSGYISSEKSTKDGINCPMCRKFTPISGYIDRENWVNKFLENPQVTDIANVDGVTVENMEVKREDCQTCVRDDKHVKALFFCFYCNEQICMECRNFHLKMKVLKHHIIADLESVETDRKRQTMLVTDCVIHPGKQIKYFCHDHKTLCCSKCLFVTHRKCSYVTGVEDCLDKFKGKPDLSEIIKETKHMMDGIHAIQTNDRAVLNSLQSDVENVPRILDECKKHMLEAFNVTCSRIDKAVKEKYTEECGKLNCHLRACKTLEDDLKIFQNVAQIVAEHGDDIQQFVATRRYEDAIAIHVRDMVRLVGDTTSVTIQPAVGDKFKQHVTELDKYFSVKVNVSIPNQCERNTWNRKLPCVAGDQPDGDMEVHYVSTSVAGYEQCGSIQITYTFRSGQQGPSHPQPGHTYKGIQRTAYLPDNEQGQLVLAMLKVAFKRKVIFTIGDSRITGHKGVITWNDIHHKTDHRKNTQFGYPDPTYLTRVKDELAAKGVTEADVK